MKSISEKEIEKRIRKVYEAGRKWRESSYSNSYAIRIDSSNAEIWIDLLSQQDNNYLDYHDKNIQILEPGIPITYYESIRSIESNFTAEAIRILTEAGWTITE